MKKTAFEKVANYLGKRKTPASQGQIAKATNVPYNSVNRVLTELTWYRKGGAERAKGTAICRKRLEEGQSWWGYWLA